MGHCTLIFISPPNSCQSVSLRTPINQPPGSFPPCLISFPLLSSALPLLFSLPLLRPPVSLLCYPSHLFLSSHALSFTLSSSHITLPTLRPPVSLLFFPSHLFLPSKALSFPLSSSPIPSPSPSLLPPSP